MAIIIDDSCTDTNNTHLENHTPEEGTWVNEGSGGFGEYAEIFSNRLRMYPFGPGATYSFNMTSTNNMFLEALKPSATNFGTSGKYTSLLVRCTFVGSIKSGYGLKLLYGSSGSAWVEPSIVRYDNDIETVLDTGIEFNGLNITFKILITGSIITAYKTGDIEICSASDNTYTTGKAGMYFNAPTESSILWDDIYGETIESPTIYVYPFPCFNPAGFQV